ncbi:hypothetical protein V6768_23230 [Tistrella mobilis]
MDGYDALLAALDCPTWLRQLRQGAYLTEAFFGDDAPPLWYGCPPALVPIMSDGSSTHYKGLWINWFRRPARSYVVTEPENGFLLEEVAITDDQFAVWIIINAIVAEDGVSEDITRFHEISCPIDLSRILAYVKRRGDDPEYLDELDIFRSPRPAWIGCQTDRNYGVLRTDGTGSRRMELSPGLELDPQERILAAETPDAAPWLRRDAPVARLFDDYLSSGRQAEAWATLNSTGWSLPDARAAAERLAATTDLPGLALQLRAWIAFSQQTDMPERYGY